MIRVIGIGSPFGDDRAGLEVARRLAVAPPADTTVWLADRPGVELLEMVDGAAAVILVDAVRSGAPEGTVHDFALDAVPRPPLRSASSHGFGVGDVLALARALGRLPPRGRVIAIEAARADGVEGPLTAAVEAGVATALARARQWAHHFHARGGDHDGTEVDR
jgi:hydrogenase maturation protease